MQQRWIGRPQRGGDGCVALMASRADGVEALATGLQPAGDEIQGPAAELGVEESQEGSWLSQRGRAGFGGPAVGRQIVQRVANVRIDRLGHRTASMLVSSWLILSMARTKGAYWAGQRAADRDSRSGAGRGPLTPGRFVSSAQLSSAADRQVGAEEQRHGGHQLPGVARQPVLGVPEVGFGGFWP